MTSLDERVTRLENAFVELVPLVRELVESQNLMAATQSRMEATQSRILETLEVHTSLLQSVVGTLQGHSADLTLIKSYLNTQD